MAIAGVQGGLGHTVGITAPNGFNDDWDDLPGPVNQAGGVSALTYEQYDTAPFFFWMTRHDQDDALYYTFQLRHTWKRGTAVHLHVHYKPLSTWVPGVATKAVGWEVTYLWAATGDVVSHTAAGWTVVPCPISLLPTDQYKELISELVDINPPANAKESSILHVRLRRLGATGVTDTYNDNKTWGATPAANVAITDVDGHYQRDKAGTPQEYPV